MSVRVAIDADLEAMRRRSPLHSNSPTSAAPGSNQPAHERPNPPSPPRANSANVGTDHGPRARPNTPSARRPARNTPKMISVTTISEAGTIAVMIAMSITAIMRWPAYVDRHPRLPNATGSAYG